MPSILHHPVPPSPPCGSSPLTSLLTKTPRLIYKILEYICHVTSSFGLMTCCKGFLNLERECLDLSFTSYEIQVYERLCNDALVYKNIKTLDLRNTKISSLPPLPSSIKLLGLSGTAINSLSPLTSLPNLQYLYALHLPITEITDLRYCKSLKVLNVSGTCASRLEGLQNCKNLEELEILSCPISDITILKNCINLKKLNISFTPIIDLKPLEDLIKLEYLSCNFLSSVSDYSMWEGSLGGLVEGGKLREIQCGQIRGGLKERLERGGCDVHP
ncbi:hypothetical protein TL16_g00567 [Triparma laevis f. inornata]|uniref:Uncharacterized protein n=1 Tax=Triparma laevis f. inornata TaxID=1714386 RepID=A0A9W6Z8W7_9STRA|nr:hypothetical protein TL16_g00567 [Triparma laevis f. inornata]